MQEHLSITLSAKKVRWLKQETVETSTKRALVKVLDQAHKAKPKLPKLKVEEPVTAEQCYQIMRQSHIAHGPVEVPQFLKDYGLSSDDFLGATA